MMLIFTGLCKTTDSSSLPIALLQSTRNTPQCSVNVDETLKCMGSQKIQKTLSVCARMCVRTCVSLHVKRLAVQCPECSIDKLEHIVF